MSSEADGFWRMTVHICATHCPRCWEHSGGKDRRGPCPPRLALCSRFKYSINVITWLGFLNSEGHPGVRIWLGLGWGNSSGRAPWGSTQSVTLGLLEQDGGRVAPGSPRSVLWDLFIHVIY